ncbi:MAG: O-antigen ligase family protein [Pseudomonadota bacterium]
MGFLVSAFIFFPIALSIKKNNRLPGFAAIDRFYLTYAVLILMLSFRENTLTNGLRGVVMAVTGSIATYLVFSRFPQTREDLERIIRYFVIAMTFTGVIAIISSVLYWNFYTAGNNDLFGGQYFVKVRGGLLRISSTFSDKPINFGLITAMALVLFTGVMHTIQSKLGKVAIIGILILGAFTTGSRGPVVSALIGFMVMFLARQNPVGTAMKFGFGLTFAAAIAALTPQGQAILDYIPFIGSQGTGEVGYRQRLMEVGSASIASHPLFGSQTFMEEPAFEDLRTGEGIIDIVNAHLGTALRYGLIALFLYLSTFFGTAIKTLQTARSLSIDDDREWRYLGGAMAGTIVLYLIGFTTTSFRGISGTMGVALIGLSIAYVRITLAEQATRTAKPPEKNIDDDDTLIAELEPDFANVQPRLFGY